MAAGAVLIREAGGVVSDWEGEDRFLESGDLLAGAARGAPYAPGASGGWSTRRSSR